jgi:hypothetical protein
MVTPLEAQDKGLQGTLLWTTFCEELDSELCGWMVHRKHNHASVTTPEELVPLILEIYGKHWTVRDMGLAFPDRTRKLFFSLSEEQERQLIVENIRRRDREVNPLYRG